MTNKQQQHDANEQLSAEQLQVAQRYASMAVPRPSSQQTRELIAQLQSQTLPKSLDPLPMRPPRSGRRRQPVLEVLVAVALVGILIGGFVVLLSTRRTPGPAHVKPVPAQENLPWYGPTTPGTPPEFLHDNSALLVVDHGMVFTQLLDDTSETTALYALRASDGQVLWHAQTGTGENRFAVLGGNVYVPETLPGNIHRLVALQVLTGEQLWSSPGISAVAFAQQGETLYVVSIVWTIPPGGTPFDLKSQSTLLALSAQKGNLLWSSPIHTTIPTSQDVGPLLVDQNRLLFGTDPQKICAYQTGTGHQLWCTSPIMNASSAFVLVNHVIYTLGGGQSNELEALDPANGYLLWARGIPVGSGLLEISRGTVFLLTLNSAGNNSLFALSLADGHQLWSTDYPNRILAVVIGS
jgi:outer membrane protein assembly factor BamB